MMPRTRLLTVTFLALVCAAPAICQGATPAIDAAKVRREATAAVQNGDFAAAAAGFRQLCDADPNDARAWHMLGYSLHAGGELDAALPVHHKAAGFAATAQPATYNVACVHALQGRTDAAFEWLDKAVALGFADLDLLDRDTDLASLREDPRFATLRDTLRAKVGPLGPPAFVMATPRRASRIVWFAENGGQVAVAHAPVPWNPQYDQLLASGKFVGRRWRLGADFWTTLDTQVTLRFGDVTVAPGHYYLTALQRDADTFVLCLHDPAKVRKQRLDPVFAQRLQGGIEVPLAHTTGDATAEQLAIDLSLVAPRSANGALTVRYGGHTLTAPMTVALD